MTNGEKRMKMEAAATVDAIVAAAVLYIGTNTCTWPNAYGHSCESLFNTNCRKCPRMVMNNICITEVSEVKSEVKMEVNSLRSWELKWTIVAPLASSKAIVQPALLA